MQMNEIEIYNAMIYIIKIVHVFITFCGAFTWTG